MHHGVFSTTNIIINREPKVSFGFIERCLVIMRISKTKEVPTRTSKTIHSVSFSLRWAATLRTGRMNKTIDSCEWAAAIATRFIFINIRQYYWQLIFWHWYYAVFFTMYNRYWCAPVTLTTNQPITHLVVDDFFSTFLLRQPSDYFIPGNFTAQAS